MRLIFLKHILLINLVALSSLTYCYATIDTSYATIKKTYNKILNTDSSISSLIKYGDSLRFVGKKDSSLYYFQVAYDLVTKEGDLEKINSIKNKLGLAYAEMGVYDKALKLLTSSRNYFLSANDSFSVSNINSHLGNLYESMNDRNKAKEMYLKVLNFNKRNNNPRGIALMYSNLGNISYYKSEYEKSKSYLDSAKAIFKSNNLYLEEAKLNLSIANNYIISEDYPKAENIIKEAIKIFKKQNIKEGLAIAYNNLGALYAYQEKYELAIEVYKKSIDLKQELKLRTYMKGTYRSMAEAYKQISNYKKAYYYQNMYIALNDSLLNENLIKKISDIQIKYELEIRENKIEALNKEIEINQLKINKDESIRLLLYGIITLTFVIIVIVITFFYILKKRNKSLDSYNQQLEAFNEELNRSNSSKTKLLSVMSHDLKNQFIGIERLSEILKTNINKFDSDKINHFISEIHNGAKDINSLLSNLLKWASTQLNDFKHQPIKFNLGNSIKREVANQKLEILRKKLNVNIDIKDEQAFADEEMVNTVFRNLLSNAIKFSNTNDDINIELSKKNDKLVLMIKDNGIGIKKEDINKLFLSFQDAKTIGSSNEKGTGLGLVLCKELIEINNGEIWVESNINKGSSFYFSLPINNTKTSK